MKPYLITAYPQKTQCCNERWFHTQLCQQAQHSVSTLNKLVLSHEALQDFVLIYVPKFAFDRFDAAISEQLKICVISTAAGVTIGQKAVVVEIPIPIARRHRDHVVRGSP